MPLRNAGCLAAWREASSYGAERQHLCFLKRKLESWGAPPRARWQRPDLNAPLMTHRKWVWTLHTGRWLAPSTRCGKPFWGYDLKCLNILFLSLLFLSWVPQFEWEPLRANWCGCGILCTPWRNFNLYLTPVTILHLQLRLPLCSCSPAVESTGLSERWEGTQGACCFCSWKWTSTVKNKSAQLSWVRLEGKASWVPNMPAWAGGPKWEKAGWGTDVLVPSKSAGEQGSFKDPRDPRKQPRGWVSLLLILKGRCAWTGNSFLHSPEPNCYRKMRSTDKYKRKRKEKKKWIIIAPKVYWY